MAGAACLSTAGDPLGVVGTGGRIGTPTGAGGPSTVEVAVGGLSTEGAAVGAPQGPGALQGVLQDRPRMVHGGPMVDRLMLQDHLTVQGPTVVAHQASNGQDTPQVRVCQSAVCAFCCLFV